MSRALGPLLEQLNRPDVPGTYSVAPISTRSKHYVGRDHQGHAAVLIQTSGSATRVPLLLSGIAAQFGVSCRIEERNSTSRLEQLSVITCMALDRQLEAYFSTIMGALVSALAPLPTIEDVVALVERLVDMFQRLSRPPKRLVAGLAGELLVIRNALDPASAIRAWRQDQSERWDFAADSLRLDAKATTTERRSHEVSYEQANPPAGILSLFSSVIVYAISGGQTISDLLHEIEDHVAEHSLSLKLRAVVADTMGKDLFSALEWAFDRERADDSLRLYLGDSIPAIRPPLPAGVSGVRFTADFESCQPVTSSWLAHLPRAAQAILPV